MAAHLLLDLQFRRCPHTGFHQVNISAGTKDEDHSTLESGPEFRSASGLSDLEPSFALLKAHIFAEGS